METEPVSTLTAGAPLAAIDETRLVVVLVGLLTLGLVDSQIVAPLLPQIAEGLGTSEGWVGRTVSGYAVAAAIAALLIAPLSDKAGRRRFLNGAAFVLGVGSAVASLTPGIFGFFLARIVTGAGAGITSALVVAAIADVVPYERRGRSMGWVASAYFAAPVLGVPIAAWVGDSLGWRSNYIALALLGCILGLAVHAWFREAVRPQPAATRPRSYLSLLSSRSTAAGAFSAFFVTGGLTGFLLFLSAYLQKSFGLGLRQVGWVFLLCGATGVLGAFGAGWLSDRVGKLRVAVAGCLALAVFLMAVPYARGASLYVVLGLVGLAAAARLAPLQSIITELVAPDSRGAYVALRNTLSQCGNATAAVLVSSLYERGFEYVCFLTAGFSLAAFLLLFFIEEPR